jgi:hypothetical protein
MQLVLDSFSLSLSLNQLSKSCFFERPAQNMLVKCSQWLATGPGPSGGLRAYVAYKSQKENQDIYNGYCDVNYRGTSGFGFDPSHGKKNHGVSVQVLAPPPAAAPPAAPVGAVVEAPRRHRKSQIVIAMHTLW